MNNRIFAATLLVAGVGAAAAPSGASAQVSSGTRVATSAGAFRLSTLSPTVRAQLVASANKARAIDLRPFTRVRSIYDGLPELERSARGPLFDVSEPLKSLGSAALIPMLEQIAVAGAPQGTLSDRAWNSWRIGLLEAVGSFRDPHAAPVLEAVLDGPEVDRDVVHAAAEALGALATDGAARKLIALSREPAKRLAVLAGMAGCRRAIVAGELSTAVRAHPSKEEARVLIASLGNIGSAWAWKTPAVAKIGEGQQVRADAARALVAAFVAYDGEERAHASDALMMVDDPSTPSLIEAAKAGAPPATAKALVELAARFARNPGR